MLNTSKFLKLQERQIKSGLTVRGFCANEGIAPSSFYYWLKKINNEANGKRFIPLVVKSAGENVNPFLKSELPQGRRTVSVRPDASCFDNLLEIILEPKLVS